jgi:hypothetical protein
MSVKTLQDLTIPRQEDVIFVRPEASQWFRLRAENKSPSETLPHRTESRSELLAIARNYTRELGDGSCPDIVSDNIIATGHQPSWHHCGILAKDLVACKFAQAVGGTALHLVLDHDICDTALMLPEKDTEEYWHFRKVQVESEPQNIPLELRPPPGQAQLKTFLETVVSAHPERFCSSIWPECKGSANNQPPRFRSVADLITYLQCVLKGALGLEMLYLPVSELCKSTAFVDFVVSIISNAAVFAGCYNEGVARQTDGGKPRGTKVIARLAFDKAAGRIELPFWLISPSGRRTSLHVGGESSDKIRIGTASAELGELDAKQADGKARQLKDIIKEQGYLLRPKAVALTLFVRLYLADLFVHGVGAASYEPVTDYVIERFYNVKPPRFAVATCTMRLSSAASAQQDISALRNRLRRIRHNPEEYIAEPALAGEPVASLLRSKKELIIKATDPAAPNALRKTAWNSLSIINCRLYEYARDTAKMLEREVDLAEKSRASDQVRTSRDFFFGLFPQHRLRELAEPAVFQYAEGAKL